MCCWISPGSLRPPDLCSRSGLRARLDGGPRCARKRRAARRPGLRRMRASWPRRSTRFTPGTTRTMIARSTLRRCFDRGTRRCARTRAGIKTLRAPPIRGCSSSSRDIRRRTTCAESSSATLAIARPRARISRPRSCRRRGMSTHALAAARAAADAHEPEAAVALCREGLAQAPAHIALWRTLGLAQLQRRDGDCGRYRIRAALLRYDPDDAETHYNHGVALQMQGRLRRRRARVPAGAGIRARPHRRRLQPRRAVSGAGRHRRGDHGVRVGAEARIRATRPRTRIWAKCCSRPEGSTRGSRTSGASRRTVPRALPLAVQALEACQYRGDFAKLERYLDGLRREEFRADDELQLADCLEELLFLLLYFDIEPETIFKFAQTYDATAKRVYGAPLPRPAVRRPGRLRIGYLSADLRNHVMGKMMWQAIAHHDRTRFELYFYSLSTRERRVDRTLSRRSRPVRGDRGAAPSAPRRSASPRTTSTSSSISRRTPRARSPASSR